jgi:hypothetical protein
MIFKTLDLHISTRDGPEPLELHRRFRPKVNHIIDSFSLRIPKRTKTLSFRKLNVCVNYERSQNVPFFAVEGIGCVELIDPSISTIYLETQQEAARRAKEFLRAGISIAAVNDELFAEQSALWDHLLKTAEDELEYDCRISRSHPSRRWRCETVLVITPQAYHYDVLVRDAKSGQEIQRHRIKTTKCVLPIFTGIGLCDLRWEQTDVVGYAEDAQEVFRFQTKLPA